MWGRKAKEGNADESNWKITVHEIFCSQGGTRIMSSFTVSVPPYTTVDKFIKTCRSCRGNKGKDATTANNLKPFDPSRIGRYDEDKLCSENPEGKPNCTWNPDATITIEEAGLCDGAELSFGTRRIND